MSKKKIFDKNNFKDCETGKSENPPEIAEDRLAQKKPVNTIFGGLLNSPPPQPNINYMASKGEKVLGSMGGNASISFGQDKPGIDTSGMGAVGAPSDTIDLVVGRMASANSGEGPSDGMFVGNSFAADAARIYISRLTKIDNNFGLDKTILESVKEPARSAIGIKADKVRIIGREGVKIVTGGMKGVEGYGPKGETNSQGGNISAAPKIDLMAGNWSAMSPKSAFPVPKFLRKDEIAYLQPLVRGDNLVECLTDLMSIIDDMSDALSKLASNHQKVCTALSVGLTASSASGFAVFPPSETAKIAAQGIKTGIFSNKPVYTCRKRLKIGLQALYLLPRGHKSIRSKNVRAT